MKRVAIVTGAPAPYREPLFDQISDQPGVETKIFYCCPGHGDTGWSLGKGADTKKNRTFLWNLTPSRFRRSPLLGYVNPWVIAQLLWFRPNLVVVYGYNQMTYIVTFLVCRLLRIPYVLRSDSNAVLDKSRATISKFRRWMLLHVSRHAYGVLPVGVLNRHYWTNYGIRNDRFFMMEYAVANTNFNVSMHPKPLDNQPTRFLYVGRLIKRKGVDQLIEAFNRLVKIRSDVELVIVGDGDQKKSLQQLQTPAAQMRTCWAGKLPNDQVAEHIHRASVFVLPSRYEPWGLVVNEAMAGGLPVISHWKTGSALELVKPNLTGWLLRSLCVGELELCMAEAANNPIKTQQMGRNASRWIKQWTHQRCVNGLMGCLQSVA